ncbi:thioredoxin-like protein [Tirmania nivea]|nr:thioredoxin-like protein [Tirmania nivea]
MSNEAEQLFRNTEAVESPRKHPEDKAHLSSDEEPTEAEEYQKKLLEDQENFETDMPLFKSSTALARGNYNTGVKGVISDAYSYETAKRREMRIMRERQDCSPPSAGHQRGRSIGSPNLSDSDELMIQWRKNRMAELKAAAATTRRQSPSKRSYGKVDQVDANGYLDAIEKVSKDTVVVVVVYSDRSTECSFALDCLGTIAKRYPTTRFVKLHHTEAEMDDEVVPAILAYKAGDLFNSIMRVVDEIPSGRSLSTESLELVLLKQRIISKDDKA